MIPEQDFLCFVAGVFDVKPDSLSLATAYESLPQWDSVMHIRLAMEFAERYGIDIPLEKIPEMRTLGDFFRCIP